MNYSAQEIFDILNEQDECTWIEAKGGSESSHSVMETVCSFSNEPGLGGGYIIMGIAIDTGSLLASACNLSSLRISLYLISMCSKSLRDLSSKKL